MADEVWLPSGITSNWVVNTYLCWYVLLCTFERIACMGIHSQHTLQRSCAGCDAAQSRAYQLSQQCGGEHHLHALSA